MRSLTALSLALILPVVCSAAAWGQTPQVPTGQGRVAFEQFAARHDANRDGQIQQDEFQGNPQYFRILDSDGDGKVTAEEYQRAAPPANRQAAAMQLPAGVKVLRDLEYAQVDGATLRLDLYLPEISETRPPLLVWIHGGGWTKGSKSALNPVFRRLTAQGYAVASIDYRLDGLASHPRQIHDCKGAIRWLRASADTYGYDPARIGVGGGSAGGHLVLLLGLSGGVDELEGDVGGNLDQSSRVQAVVDLYGPSALGQLAERSERFRRNQPPEALATFDAMARSASPVTYLTADDPPLLILHGDKDPVVSVSQSQLMHDRYQEAGLDSSLRVIAGAQHGGPEFSTADIESLVKEFLDHHIKRAGSQAQ